jgi:hypothetical protein
MNARQRRPDLHRPIFNLIVSGVSQRRIALLCATTQITVARKLVLMAKFANSDQDRRLARMKDSVETTDFEEMETSEHTKCKPVAIAAAVQEPTRIIMRLKAASMPEKGRLAKISRRRYGKCRDDRRSALSGDERGSKPSSFPVICSRLTIDTRRFGALPSQSEGPKVLIFSWLV